MNFIQQSAIRKSAIRNVSLNRYHSGHLWDLLAEAAFDPHVKGEIAARAPVAGAVKADLHDAALGHVDQFDIAPVGLHGRPDQLDHGTDAVAHCRIALDGVHLPAFSELYRPGAPPTTRPDASASAVDALFAEATAPRFRNVYRSGDETSFL